MKKSPVYFIAWIIIFRIFTLVLNRPESEWFGIVVIFLLGEIAVKLWEK